MRNFPFNFQSLNMPGEHRDMYVSTTLSIVIFTTIVCGGLTAPMMSRMGMRQSTANAGNTLISLVNTNTVNPGMPLECHYEVSLHDC